MSEYKLKTGKIEETVVNGYKKIEEDKEEEPCDPE